ncbi:MAG: adenylate/guanylate cyclase domain-containing protein [Hyphomicrobiaceae bacterium]|nr:adenylate/guanylate cyclase domain-containing protein [Hyphomicrobiaceae bacterium]
MSTSRMEPSGKRTRLVDIARWLAPLAELGTRGYPVAVRRRLMIVNVTAYLIALFSLFYAGLFAVYDIGTYMPLVLANLLLMVIALLAPLAHRIGEICAAVIIAVAEFASLFFFVRTLGHDSGVQINYLVAAAIPFAIFGLSHLWLVIATIIIGLALHLVAWFLYPTADALVPPDPSLLNNLYISSVITTGSIIAVIVLYAFTLADRARAEADTLLRHILPEPVAERLKARPGTRIADSIPEASVMFTDLSGFTPLAKDLGAEQTLDILDDIFTEFDALAVKHGVEKIKTIGDGYMAACGVISPVRDHGARLARLALDLPGTVEALSKRHGMNLQIRIGLARGPVMAGVIGADKFFYDVWGETVNLASRLESHGLPGTVHVSREVHDALCGEFHFEPRGRIDIKGVGQLETWLLKNEKRV